ncbi:hypothetical protein NIBR502774_14305 (plasmid) [Rhizobium sp. NIBRBAC000502774]|nr:hypothetical protein NIBR502774_14305 [Rhizobium sp. NIBRBAC000502774]
MPMMADERRNDIARRYVSAFAGAGSDTYIRNLRTTVTCHQWGEACLPMTINNGEPQATFVCSPWVGYIDYTKEELARFPNPAIVPALNAVISCVAKVLTFAEVDKIVHINNWMMSTNLLPDLDCDLVSAQTKELTLSFPNHFLAIRSLTGRHHRQLIASLNAESWVLLPSRQIFIADDITDHLMRRRDLKRDEALWRQSAYHYEELETVSRQDAERIAELYAMLYLEKYSSLNPAYTADFVMMSHEVGMIRYLVHRDQDGLIQSFCGIHQLAAHATVPLMGYNTRLDQSAGLYRLGFYAGARYASRHGLSFNMSSGATGFKTSRGATAEIEYTAFYFRHLPLARRLPMRILGAVAHGIGIPLLKKYQL